MLQSRVMSKLPNSLTPKLLKKILLLYVVSCCPMLFVFFNANYHELSINFCAHGSICKGRGWGGISLIIRNKE